MRFVRFGMILVASVGLYFAIHALKQHGVEPADRDFWVCLMPPFVAGLVVMMSSKSGKKENK